MSQYKILITDDMQSMRGMLKSILVQAGFDNLTEAENGQSAMNKLQEEKFDLVICDWDMPRMSGLEVLESIRADESLHQIPFIMVTANSDRDKVTRAIDAGTDGYIIKPLQPDTLLQLTTKLLGIADPSAAPA